MIIGLIDVDGHKFPNLPLMKISAWHKRNRENVTWFSPLWNSHWARVYMAKVFSFTPDYSYPINASEIIMGGSGYHIRLQDGKEVWQSENDYILPRDIEHIYPDYSLYGITDQAFGFLSRGCPRQCMFCHVKSKEGTQAHKVANLDEFWRGQKKITIMDPNILAVPQASDLLQQLADSKSWVDINQGLDARLLTEEKIEIIRKIKMKRYHFAWDNPKDENKILPKLKQFSEMIKVDRHNTLVYCLVNYNSTLEEDLYRVYKLKSLNMQPYVMIYDKKHADPIYKNLQRYVNSPMIFWSVNSFSEYKGGK